MKVKEGRSGYKNDQCRFIFWTIVSEIIPNKVQNLQNYSKFNVTKPFLYCDAILKQKNYLWTADQNLSDVCTWDFFVKLTKLTDFVCW